MITTRRSLLCLIATGLAALLILVAGTPGSPSAASQVDRATLVQQWVDARNRGDVDGVLALQTENAVWIAGPCQAQSPCLADGIRAVAETNAATHARFSLSSLQVAGSIVTARYELRSDTNCNAGVERVVGTVLLNIPQDKIALYVGLNDVADAQTAMSQAVAAGRQPAGPRPAGCS
jgi:ketosteroid isomerase-like protein